jgi:hypothetical protein
VWTSALRHLGHAAAWLAAWLDRRRMPLLALLTMLFAAQFTAAARHKPLWHDEIYTVLLARVPSIGTQWAALRDGVDLVPPLNGFATRAVIAVAGHGPVAVRIPAAIGFWTMVLAIFVMVRRRSHAALAFAAVFIPFSTPAFRYSYEARPYGLMMGLAAVAWLAWSEAARGHRRRMYVPVLAVALAAGLWNHYFAILVYAPIVAGELVRIIRARRIDAPVWAAIGVSLAAALPLAPLINAAAGQRQHFWAHASSAEVSDAYRFLFADLWTGPLPWVLGVIAVVAVCTRLWPVSLGTTEPIPLHEGVAAAMAMLVPALGVLLALAITGAFVPRYALAAIGAVSVALPVAASQIARTGPIAGVVLLIALAAGHAASFATIIRSAPYDNPVAARPLLAASLRQPGPTVASAQLWFLQLWYYAPPELKTRMVYLADPARSLQYTGSDTMDRNYLALARWTAVPVEPLDTFLSRQRDLRIYASGSGWLLEWLRDMHAQIEPMGTEAGGQLYSASLHVTR